MRNKTIKELRELIKDLNDDDVIVIETIDLETGDAQDLYPLYLDVIDISRTSDGTYNEVRFCHQTDNRFYLKVVSELL